MSSKVQEIDAQNFIWILSNECFFYFLIVRMSNDVSLPANQRRNYTGLMDVTQRIIKEEGVSAFWRGSTPFVQRAMLVGVFQGS